MAPDVTMPSEVTDYTRMTKRELISAFCVVTSLFFLWSFSYGLLDVLNQRCLSLPNVAI